MYLVPSLWNVLSEDRIIGLHVHINRLFYPVIFYNKMVCWQDNEYNELIAVLLRITIKMCEESDDKIA